MRANTRAKTPATGSPTRAAKPRPPEWGVKDSVLRTGKPLRYRVDRTEQAHHLAGPLGTAVTDRFFELGYPARGRVPRSVRLTPRGQDELAWLQR